MTRYLDFLGKRVETLYRSGCANQTAFGVLITDSGDFVLIANHFDEPGHTRVGSLRIPYDRIIRLTPLRDLYL